MSRFFRFTNHPLVEKLFLGGLAVVYALYLIGYVRGFFPTASTPPITIIKHTLPTNSSAILHYWTPANIRSAIDDDQKLSQGSNLDRQGNGNQQVNPQAAQRGQGTPPDRGDASLYPLSTVGKLFFVRSGQRYVCSGTAIVSANHNTVNTAAHCLYQIGVDRIGSWAEEVLFCPLYDNANGPYGCWAAHTLEVPSDWIVNPKNAFYHDMGMVVVNANNEGNLTDVVGGAGWAYNQPVGQYFYAYGYPTSSPFEGKTTSFCQGEGIPWSQAGGPVVSLLCATTEFSSGGPWFIEDGGNWYLGGHNDFVRNVQPGHIFSPYYDNTWHALYEQAQEA
ncbi:MAG TPA: hypothetical protein VFV38_48865 [Ktedonobacteraceae bacterium]|nr:hypothetical protein [Ktedonobacteraceae bacterium]